MPLHLWLYPKIDNIIHTYACNWTIDGAVPPKPFLTNMVPIFVDFCGAPWFPIRGWFICTWVIRHLVELKRKYTRHVRWFTSNGSAVIYNMFSIFNLIVHLYYRTFKYFIFFLSTAQLPHNWLPYPFDMS